MKLNCAQVALEKAFYNYGKLVGRKPLPFLIVPIIVTALLAIGMVRFELVTDVEFLYTPTNGQAKDERDAVQERFNEAADGFVSTRKTTLDGFVQIVITRKSTGENIFNAESFDAIRQLDSDIHAIRISYDSATLTYKDLCEKWEGSCEENSVLTLFNSTSDFDQVTYPFHSDVFLPTQLGKAVVDSDTYVTSVEAVLLSYYVQYKTDGEVAKADIWLGKVKEFLVDYENDVIGVSFQTALSLEEEISAATKGIIPYFSVAYTILFNFSVLTCLMRDWVRSKPFAAMGGELAASFAIATSLGVLSACGLPFASTVGVMPFLIIGIGIDDMFVIVSSWRHTNFLLPVEERMGQTLQTAAVSITVTSLTDALAFGIGSITTFRAVTYFCAYTGVAVIFSYIYAITFFAACMTYSGRREAANRHAYTFKKIKPTALSSGSSAFMFCCTGGYLPETDDDILANGSKQDEMKKHSEDPQVSAAEDVSPQNTKPETNTSSSKDTEKDNKSSKQSTLSGEIGDREKEMFAFPWLTEFLRDKLGPLVVRTPVKLLTLFLYLIYLGFAIWGCISLTEGLQLKNLAPDDSYLVDFYADYNDHFLSHYGPRVMVVITENLDYSDASVRDKVFTEIQTFTNSSVFYSEESYSESWLKAFDSYLELSMQSPSNLTDFITILRNQFLPIPGYDTFSVDITFNSDYSEISASRFLLQSTGVANSLQERELMKKSRELAEDSIYEMTVFHPAFIYYDQYIVIVSNTLQNLGIAVGCMLFVSFFLLPSLLSVLFVTLSVISIVVGVFGFMVFWNVNLDSISMINLIMCIGFSVDFSAHISYHFSISSLKTGNQKAADSIAQLGMPIIQGAISTVLGVVVLAFSNSYIFRTFFKIILLVMIFGFLHALFILPVVLSVISPLPCSFSCEDRQVKPNEQLSNSSNKLQASTENLQPEDAQAIVTPKV